MVYSPRGHKESDTTERLRLPHCSRASASLLTTSTTALFLNRVTVSGLGVGPSVLWGHRSAQSTPVEGKLGLRRASDSMRSRL